MTARRWLDYAATEASKGAGEFRHAAVLLYKGHILAVGRNRFCAKYGDSVHAECDMLRRAPKHISWKRVTVFVARVGYNDEWRNSKPCVRCTRMLQRKGIEAVWYTTPRGPACEDVDARLVETTNTNRSLRGR